MGPPRASLHVGVAKQRCRGQNKGSGFRGYVRRRGACVEPPAQTCLYITAEGELMDIGDQWGGG